MKKNVILILICCTFLLPKSLYADEVYKAFSVGRFDAFLDTNYFKTLANYGPGGEKTDLPINSYLQHINLKTQGRYLILNDIGIYSGLNFGNIESFNGTNSRSNSTLTHFFVGADYQFYLSENLSLYADVSADKSNIEVNINQDDALPSNGATELRALFVGTLRGEALKGFGKVGVNQRSDGLSTLLLYGAGIEYQFGNYSALGFELDGSSTVKDDQYTETPLVRDTLTNRVNAGSRIFYSINPNILNSQIYYSYSIDRNLSFKIKAGTTLTGSNSANGYNAGVSINWGFGGYGNSRHKKPKVFIENSTSISDEDPGFKIDTTDGVNQDLFKQTQPVNPKK